MRLMTRRKTGVLPNDLGVARVGGQHPFVDAEDRERPIVFAVEIGVKYEAGVGGAG